MTNVLSKKKLNLLTIKLLIKLKLNNVECNVNNYKEVCYNYLNKDYKSSNYYIELQKYINNISKQKFISFQNRANNLIEKYNFIHSDQIILDFTEFKDIISSTINLLNKQEIQHYTVSTVINILNELKQLI